MNLEFGLDIILNAGCVVTQVR